MPLRPVSGAASALTVPALLTLLLATGCAGGTSSEASGAREDVGSKAPDADTAACRAKWEALGRDVDGRDTASTPSTLPDRWNSVAATIDYYVTSGTAKDCGDTLTGQQRAMARLEAFDRQLAPYDLALTLSRVQADGSAYAKRSRPARVPGKKGRPARTGPQPRQVAKALSTLRAQAPRAAQQQGPAWQQATATDPGDAKAVAKAVKDLKFLSSQSAAYRAGSAAAAQVRAAVSLTR